MPLALPSAPQKSGFYADFKGPAARAVGRVYILLKHLLLLSIILSRLVGTYKVLLR